MIPAMSERGDLVWLDEHGNRDFSPRTARRIQLVAAALLTLAVALGVGAVTGVVEPAPWSPLGKYEQQQEQIERQRTPVPVAPKAPTREPGLKV